MKDLWIWCFKKVFSVKFNFEQPDDVCGNGKSGFFGTTSLFMTLFSRVFFFISIVRPHDSPVAKTHLVQFYKVLHTGLTDQSRMDEMYTLIRFTGPRFFSLMLPGYTAYILDFLYAANSIISNSDLKGK